MDTKKLIILVSIVLVSVVIIQNFMESSPEKIKESDSSENISKNLCENILLPKLQDICYAYISKNIGVCYSFKGIYQEMCAKAVLSTKKVNESFCRNISNEKVKNICFRKLAKVEKNINFCQDIDCYFYYSTTKSCNLIEPLYLKHICLAKTTKSQEYCENINDEPLYLTCKGIFSNKIEDCKDYSGEYILHCVFFVAENNDWKDCLVLSSIWDKAKCVGLASNKIENCDKIDKKEYKTRDLCKIYYLAKNLDVYYE